MSELGSKSSTNYKASALWVQRVVAFLRMKKVDFVPLLPFVAPFVICICFSSHSRKSFVWRCCRRLTCRPAGKGGSPVAVQQHGSSMHLPLTEGRWVASVHQGGAVSDVTSHPAQSELTFKLACTSAFLFRGRLP